MYPSTRWRNFAFVPIVQKSSSPCWMTRAVHPDASISNGSRFSSYAAGRWFQKKKKRDSISISLRSSWFSISSLVNSHGDGTWGHNAKSQNHVLRHQEGKKRKTGSIRTFNGNLVEARDNSRVSLHRLTAFGKPDERVVEDPHFRVDESLDERRYKL